MIQTVSIDNQTALVLEGGGMRGVFTCGVLDNFMDRGIRFPYVVGVSAGASNGLSYMSYQRGRARKANIDLLEQYNYIGVKYLFTQRNIMDFNLMFHDFPERIIPYDYDVYANNPERFEMVTTDCLTGRAVYWEEKHDEKRIIDIVTASCSLPFGCPIAMVDGRPMLDGGIADSIPFDRAFSQGYEKVVVILTRNIGYRKSEKKPYIPSFLYRKYPLLKEAIRNRGQMYNAQLDRIEQLEREGKAIVIRPVNPIQVGRMEKDVKKLQALYDEGYQCSANINFQ
ncbi:MAG: patatin family protein [Bacteroidaceae bacterium]|nr:patatin family protein [Bacteroidaceae bacterium]